ncbi:MAG: YfiR family protein [Planctomycetaceae bacterium]|nr:YfiR family protein [Planctomycetaceae bacterium]
MNIGTLLLFWTICITVNCHAANEKSRSGEYNLKAVNIYGFGNYIRWPEYTKIRTDFVITVYGDSPILGALQIIASKKKIANKPIVVKSVTSISDIPQSEILFISESVPQGEISKILEHTALSRSKPLIVADTPRMFQTGIDIAFCVIEDRVRFVLDAENVNRNGLTIDAKLLRLGMAPDSPEFQQHLVAD